MFRTIRFALVLAAALTAASEARAQYGYASGYGGYGWGGWGSTPGSSMARGLGMMNMGRGMLQREHGSGPIDQHQHRHEMEPGHVQLQQSGRPHVRRPRKEDQAGHEQGLFRDPGSTSAITPATAMSPTATRLMPCSTFS